MSDARILIAAPKSGSGKTMLVCGLIGALKKRKLKVSSFKCGPDYIDPMFHRAVLGIESGNLDTWFTDPETVRWLLKRKTADSDITVIEGVMGYYDGMGGTTTQGSSAELAEVTDTPVILVADAKGASVSLVPMLKGLLSYPGGERICGVILNRVSGSYYPRLKSVIEEVCGLRVLGYIPEVPELAVPDRHLGLVDPAELPDKRAWAEAAAAQIESTVDLDMVIRMADKAPAAAAGKVHLPERVEHVRIACARDRAFTFRYAENELLFEMLGAELVPFSPMSDKKLPEDISGLILGGGYPELFAEELSGNRGMMREIRERISHGMPCIAECGGYLYLKEMLEDPEGHVSPMAGLFPGSSQNTGKLRRFGYLEAETRFGGLFGDAGVKIRGHEFHHWDSDDNGEGMNLVKPLSGKTEQGVFYGANLAAGFPHFYYFSNPEAAAAFLRACVSFGTTKRAEKRWDRIAHPLMGLGDMEEMISRIAGILGDEKLQEFDRKAVAVFCGDHGVVAQGVSQTSSDVTGIVARHIAEGNGVVNHLADKAGADVFVVDAGMISPPDRVKELMPGAVADRSIGCGTRDLSLEAAMTAEEAERAVRTGIDIADTLADRGYRILAGGEMGIGNTTPSAVLTAAFLNLSADEVTGRGAGLNDTGLQIKRAVVNAALERIRAKKLTDTMEIMAECGGYELAELTGFYLGASRKHIPVVLDGVISAVCALAAVKIDPRVRDVLIASHMSTEPGMEHVMKALNLHPVIYAGMHQGEGCGAVMLFPLLDMAREIYCRMGTFDAFGIAAYEKYGKNSEEQ